MPSRTASLKGSSYDVQQAPSHRNEDTGQVAPGMARECDQAFFFRLPIAISGISASVWAEREIITMPPQCRQVRHSAFAARLGPTTDVRLQHEQTEIHSSEFMEPITVHCTPYHIHSWQTVCPCQFVIGPARGDAPFKAYSAYAIRRTRLPPSRMSA